MTAHQQSLDAAIHLELFSEDADVSSTHASVAQTLRDTYGFQLYCPRHRGNHHYGVDEAEELIAALQASWADALVDHEQAMTHFAQGANFDDDRPSHSADEVLNEICWQQWLREVRDPEVYAEHIQAEVRARRRTSTVVPS